MKRSKLSRGGSKRLFAKTGAMTHVKNLAPTPMRGGFRL